MNKLKISIELKGHELHTDCEVKCRKELVAMALARLFLNISRAIGTSVSTLCDATKEAAAMIQKIEESEKGE